MDGTALMLPRQIREQWRLWEESQQEMQREQEWWMRAGGTGYVCERRVRHRERGDGAVFHLQEHWVNEGARADECRGNPRMKDEREARGKRVTDWKPEWTMRRWRRGREEEGRVLERGREAEAQEREEETKVKQKQSDYRVERIRWWRMNEYKMWLGVCSPKWCFSYNKQSLVLHFNHSKKKQSPVS